MRMTPLLGRALLAASMLLLGVGVSKAEARAPDPGPALWRVRDANTTLYLFGSVHVLPRKVDWMTDTLERVMHQSRTFVFEAAVDRRALRKAKIKMASEGALPRGKRYADCFRPRCCPTISPQCTKQV